MGIKAKFSIDKQINYSLTFYICDFKSHARVEININTEDKTKNKKLFD